MFHEKFYRSLPNDCDMPIFYYQRMEKLTSIESSDENFEKISTKDDEHNNNYGKFISNEVNYFDYINGLKFTITAEISTNFKLVAFHRF